MRWPLHVRTLLGAALGAGLGAGLDSAFYRRTPIYPAPAPRLSLRFAIRF